MLLTKIPIDTHAVPLIGLDPVSNSGRQLLVKSSYGAYGKTLHHGITLILVDRKWVTQVPA